MKPRSLSNHPLSRHYSIYEATPDQWVAILRLATKWGCPNIRDFAIPYIQAASISTIEKIKIFQEYDVPKEAYHSLLAELAPYDEMPEELRVLGNDICSDIVRARGTLDAPPPSPGESVTSSATYTSDMPSLGESSSTSLSLNFEEATTKSISDPVMSLVL